LESKQQISEPTPNTTNEKCSNFLSEERVHRYSAFSGQFESNYQSCPKALEFIQMLLEFRGEQIPGSSGTLVRLIAHAFVVTYCITEW